MHFYLLLAKHILGKFLYAIALSTTEDKALKLNQVVNLIMNNPDDNRAPIQWCDIFTTVDGNKAVEEVIKRKDTQTLRTLLKIEKNSHEDSHEAIGCFRKVIMTDANAEDAIKVIDTMYGPSFSDRYLIPCIYVIPLIGRMISMIYDEASDVLLAIDYNERAKENGSNCLPRSCFSGIQLKTQNQTTCNDPMADEYYFATYFTIVSVVFMLLLNGPVTSERLLSWTREFHEENARLQAILRIMFLIIGPLVSPVIILLELGKMIRLKFWITKETDEEEKSRLEEKFWKAQLDFGKYEAIESAEAAAQLLLQIWLIAPHFAIYYHDGFFAVLQNALTGAIFMFVPSSSTDLKQRILGKILIAFISISLTAFSMYKRSKREAVETTKSIFLMISILAQILVNLLCLLPLYYVERHSLSLVLPLVVHYGLVLILKIILDPGFYRSKSNQWLIRIINVLGSVVINVSAVSPEGFDIETEFKDEAISLRQLDTDDSNDYQTRSREEYHSPSTCCLQVSYLAVKLFENITLMILVIACCGIGQCVDTFSLTKYFLLTLVLGNIISYISHAIYYKFYGHPWRYSNGPRMACCVFKSDYFCLGRKKRIKYEREVLPCA